MTCFDSLERSSLKFQLSSDGKNITSALFRHTPILSVDTDVT